MRAGLLCVAVVVIGLAACTPKEEPPIPRAEARQILLDRPDIDQVVKAYEKMIKELAGRLQAAGLTNGWRDAVDREDSGCSDPDFDREGEQGFNTAQSILHWWRTAPQITPENWAAALALVTKFAAANGFPNRDVFRNEPGDRQIFFSGQKYGGMLSFRSTPTETVLGVETGCHRAADSPVDAPVYTPRPGGHTYTVTVTAPAPTVP